MSQTALSIIIDHWFWSGIIAAVVVWYSTITIYVGIKGAFDIKNMFARLRGQSETMPENTIPDKNYK
jgi:hypothetical protein